MTDDVDPHSLTDDELRSYLAEREWYHTVELRPGVETPGWFDLRPTAATLPWPDLRGARCLDVGTFEGFWAREMESRGAAEVIAIDILDPREWDWPAGSGQAMIEDLGRRKREGDGFGFVARAAGSTITRRELSVYDLDPDDIGTFDCVYVGSLLLHLRDPVRALERVLDVCRPDGRMLLVDAIDLELTVRHPRLPLAALDGVGRPWWWKPNLAGLRRMVTVAGFDIVEASRPIYLRPGAGHPRPALRPRLLADAAGRDALVTRLKGSVHASVLARPR